MLRLKLFIIFIIFSNCLNIAWSQKLFGKIELLETQNGNILNLNETAELTSVNNLLKSFPHAFKGKWHGLVIVKAISISPTFINRDQNEANLFEQYCQPGYTGSLNLDFKEDDNKNIYISPAKILFSILKPKIQVYELNLGTINNGRSLGNNLIKSKIIKNEIIRLDNDSCEQNILSKEFIKIKKNKLSYNDYALSVVRLHKNFQENRQNFDITIACCNYDDNGKFLIKLFLSGKLYPGSFSFFDKIYASINH